MGRSEHKDIEISSFAAPTADDIALLESLSDSQRKAVIAREIRKGIDSGLSEMTMEDIWAEALNRVMAKAVGTNGL